MLTTRYSGSAARQRNERLAAIEVLPDPGRRSKTQAQHHEAVDIAAARGKVIQLLPQVERAPNQPCLGGASEADLFHLGDQLGMTLPAALVDWLGICNGERLAAYADAGLLSPGWVLGSPGSASGSGCRARL